MNEYFLRQKSLAANPKLEQDLSNYLIKTHLKRQQLLIHQILLKKTDIDQLYINKLKNILTNLSNLKSKVNKLDIEKLALAPVFQ